MKCKILPVLACLIVPALASCVSTRYPPPEEIVAPQPIRGNTGKYMCPFTQDDVVAEWVDTAMKAGGASKVGGAVGSYLGAKLLENVPFIGGALGDAAGSKLAREAAIKAAGGWDHIRATSDLSFQRPQDLAVFIYARHGRRQDFRDVLSATSEIYPELNDCYSSAIFSAPRRAVAQ